jgi:hypothetical protein
MLADRPCPAPPSTRVDPGARQVFLAERLSSAIEPCKLTTEHRNSDPRDVVANPVGASVGYLVIRWGRRLAGNGRGSIVERGVGASRGATAERCPILHDPTVPSKAQQEIGWAAVSWDEGGPGAGVDAAWARDRGPCPGRGALASRGGRADAWRA